MFGRTPILVAGSTRLAGIVADCLKAGGRPAYRVDTAAQAGARLRRAHTLILADPGPATADVIDRLGALHRRAPLRAILLHPRDPPPALPGLPASAPIAVETFALEDQAARALLARRPPHAGMDPAFGQGIHLLLAGAAPPAHALALQAMRLVHYGDRQPVLTLAGEDPQALREHYLASHPQADRFCRLRFTSLDAPNLADSPPVTGVYVCMDPPGLGLATARRLAALIAGAQGVAPLVHLEIGDLHAEGEIADWDGQILPFSYLREVCRPEVLLDGRHDELARVIHDHYRDSIAAQGRDPTAEPAGQPWECLAASYRDASRHQADHLWAKLAVTDCRAVREERVESFAFAPLEVERLAVIEHARWAADRHLDGWVYAQVRDNARKHHPQLIPYADLSEPMKDLDRFAVRLLPTLLARSGRGLVRILLVGLAESGAQCPLDRRLQRLVDQALDRLVLRYPDRSLALASTLADAPARLLVRRAVEELEAGLFLLCPRPFPATLADQPDEGARRDLLELAARAERRIALPHPGELARWLAQRPEILMRLGPTMATTADRVKRVAIDPIRGETSWSFEY